MNFSPENFRIAVTAWEKNPSEDTFKEMVRQSFAAHKHSPQFEHNCEHCCFLGNVDGCDVYWCVWKRHWRPETLRSLDSILFRFGDDGSEYGSYHPSEACSGPKEFIEAMKKHNPRYLVALERAKAVGLYKGEF